MNIIQKSKVERINVVHKNFDEMHKNIEQLKAEGWSDNTRHSVVGIQLVTEDLYGQADIEEVNNRFPGVEIQYPEKGRFLHTRPYIYRTEHERVVEDETN